ncbi:hypothetical protein M436DRAFT_81474 [Aureobasidium namibiae CBS 147.97]|uniref:Apple domain-containing protein n=1 Tax=Aureobasidium namibiae CBS 147.97 TaxID=1043004 RepID=A0A074WLT2_9PEZI
MIGKHAFVGCCIAALSAKTYAQDDVQLPPTIWDRLDLPFTFTDCAAPTEMETCWKAQNYTAKDDYLVQSLGLQDRMECALTNCWNRVYSCDYQQLLLSYNSTCSLVMSEDEPALNLPFWPAPADAAESCSCDLNKLNDNLPDNALSLCMEKVKSERGDPDDSEERPTPDCDCCLYGAYAAGAWDTCKDQDPGYIVLDYIRAAFIDRDSHGNNNSLAQCPSQLQNFDCTDHGFSLYGVNASDYARSTPLHSATGTWSDTNGILTAPVSGATYTWTAWNATLIITAASVEAMATRTASATGETSNSGNGSVTQKGAGSFTGSMTGTGTSASSMSTGAASELMAAQHPAAALMGLGGLVIALL